LQFDEVVIWLRASVDAEDPSKPDEKAYVKIGGILVNSSYSGKEFLLVVGKST
jgi:biotin--protein ligase